MRFIENVKLLRRSFGMFIDPKDLFEATSLVCGMDMMMKESIIGDFRDWLLSEKLKTDSAFAWSGVVKLYLDEQGIKEEDQAGAFLDLVFEFLEDKGITDVR